MKNMSMVQVILTITAAIALWAVFLYNSLIRLRTRVREAWADIDVQLKRRYDLIPNLVETVKGYAAHESGVFEKVTEARTKAIGAKTPAEHAEAENMLTGALKTLFAVAENYPQLQASQNFLELQQELRDTEDKIQAARRFYNGNVRDYNIRIQSFPDIIFARIFGFKQEEFFELEEDSEAKASVKVQF
jgi:LemA protein